MTSATAAYGLLYQEVLRPLPFHDTDRLVAIRTLYGNDLLGTTLPEYLEVEEHAAVFEDVVDDALREPVGRRQVAEGQDGTCSARVRLLRVYAAGPEHSEEEHSEEDEPRRPCPGRTVPEHRHWL